MFGLIGARTTSGNKEKWEDEVLGLVKELFAYMSARKKWWLFPILVVVVLFGGLLILAQGSAVAPFIYTIF